MLVNPAPTHDLIRLREPIALTVEAPAPTWVELALRRPPWVVVRHGRVNDGMVPVGVRSGLPPDVEASENARRVSGPCPRQRASARFALGSGSDGDIAATAESAPSAFVLDVSPVRPDIRRRSKASLITRSAGNFMNTESERQPFVAIEGQPVVFFDREHTC